MASKHRVRWSILLQMATKIPAKFYIQNTLPKTNSQSPNQHDPNGKAKVYQPYISWVYVVVLGSVPTNASLHFKPVYLTRVPSSLPITGIIVSTHRFVRKKVLRHSHFTVRSTKSGVKTQLKKILQQKTWDMKLENPGSWREFVWWFTVVLDNPP